ncbi:hypothetical protein D4764_15G0007290 [Takifugu flavidus]|uniref:Reverse transcriptase n=1 Tax=Takifugu flavidus TaxID=433684 RepID=A0A5C6P1Z4_9TELE|nr:hypothetical protein D4764_15G0007290 [Takifugu flavidus]
MKHHMGSSGLFKNAYPRCRLCGDAPETAQHITAGCKMLAGKEYMERHNQVAGIVYRNICTEYGLEIQADKMVVANQPDIVVVDKHRKTVVVIDVAIPSDSNIRKNTRSWRSTKG